jgi:predicted transcriptional regulator
MSRKQYYKQADILKGAANHYRVEILHLLAGNGDGLSTDVIVENLEANYQTGSHHIRKLVDAGLVKSWQKGRNRLHGLTECGQSFITFLKTLK